jgi:hypothetical protein
MRNRLSRKRKPIFAAAFIVAAISGICVPDFFLFLIVHGFLSVDKWYGICTHFSGFMQLSEETLPVSLYAGARIISSAISYMADHF